MSDGALEVTMRPTKYGIYVCGRDSLCVFPQATNTFYVKEGKP